MGSPVLHIPSPLQEIILPEITEAKIRLFVKRDDLIHPYVSGNKWRKLEYNIAAFKASKKAKLLTFGGAFSNHLVATAAACNQADVPCMGVIRGEDADFNNPTLAVAAAQGMELHAINREEYNLKAMPEYKEELYNRFGSVFVVPEGGANHYGVNGCMNIVKELKFSPDYVAVATGTGTTLAGISIAADKKTKVIGFPALKGGVFIENEARKLLYQTLFDEDYVKEILNKVTLETRFHFGGYGKVDENLVAFVNHFYQKTHIPLDLVYTGKLFFGLMNLIASGYFPAGSSIVAIHTGGLQGNEGMKSRGVKLVF
ncbi:MAG: 1-aminocyclopropane-1-carboxylate deaminase/D-cysteine desulfhydrase [Flavobacteriales bacterium]